ncbi:septum formation initiator family protein [Desulfothermobacter acidiphilus]|uniref:septum formation initiator family protein n=1 Tax=Desulfothermobacter acidiphilus TaxID=1938353 RepID=UPI003F8962D2
MLVAAQERLAPSWPQRGPARRPEPSRKTARKTASVARVRACSLLLLGFILGAVVVYCQGQIALVGYRLQVLERTMNEVKAENQLLETNLDRLTAPDRLEAIAKKDLGMVYPSTAAGEIVLPPDSQEALGTKVPGEQRGWLAELLHWLAVHMR